MASIVVIGLGNLGSALCKLLLDNGHKIAAYEQNAEVVEQVNLRRRNTLFLPGIEFPQGLTASTDVAEIFAQAEIIFNCLPSRFTLAVFQQGLAAIKAEARIVNLAKGVNARGLTVIEQLQRLLPHHEIAMLSGPSLANEFSQGVVTAVTLASEDKVFQQHIAGILGNSHFAVQFYDDIIAVELGGILKNIYALGLGLLDELPEPKFNLIGAYLTVAVHEMQGFMRAKTTNATAILALSGVGDLITTALSDDSHNVGLGKKLASGILLESVQEGELLPEGINTLQVFLSQSSRLGVDMPLASLIKQLAYKEVSLSVWQQQFVELIQQ